MTMPRSVLVVGGGVAGLVAARSLAMQGYEVSLFEASARMGGALYAAKLSGVDIDTGAEAFAVTRPETRTLIEELGLSANIVLPRRSDARLLLSDGMYAMPHAMLGVPTDLTATDVVEILGEIEAIRAQQRNIAGKEDFMAASGGRAGLSGGDTSGRPPESGPMSQGLRSLYKNGRKL